MKAIEVVGIIIMLVIIFARGSYGQGYYVQPMTFQQANAQFFAGMAQLEQEQARQAQAEMNRLMALAQGGGAPIADGTGGVVFPVNNPNGGFSAAVQQVNAIGSNWGMSSEELTQATIRNYQGMAAQNEAAYRQLDQITENTRRIVSGNYTQEKAAQWRRRADAASQAAGMADAFNATYRMQSQQLERDQRRTANRELYDATGKEHWQYSNRPVTAGPEQDAYDRWNRTNRRWQ